ncbi:arylsulfatase [Janibacter sp. GS2]|uniref:arylsulfatase n=1 Tax=Janibacter sp. GS2 TaxID=3442646 RepID=UPI003EBFFC90
MDDVVTYAPGEEFAGRIADTAAESTPAWPAMPAPPPGAPNVVVILFDDLGFAQLGCFGGLGGRVRTPNIDRLAERGVRYRNFHTTALCSPSRAALLTGRNHHSVGVATIMERATGYPGYNGRIPQDCAMLPEVLRQHGYATMAAGKWHLAPDEEATPAGPYDRWPLGQGFERYYGFLSGETSQWEPDLTADNHRVDPPGRPEDGYHLTPDLVDRAVEWISGVKAVAPNKPFFLYFAPGAMHSPHHVPQAYAAAYEGVFDDGWDAVRAATLTRQQDIGIMPPEVELSPRNPGVTAWTDLPEDEKRLFRRQAEVFAGFLTHTDEHVGRLLDFIDGSGLGDDTLIMLMSDNGASAEGGVNGLLSEMSYFNGSPEGIEAMLDARASWGSPETHPHYATGWAMAGNTPNRFYKAFVHEGGTLDPLIVAWPGKVADPGSVRTQFHHVVDITPTLLDVIGIEWPEQVKGVAQRPLEGTSFRYTFDAPQARTRKERQYFEMFAHRAIWEDGWKAVALHWSSSVLQRLGHIDHELHDGDWDADRWELYHLDSDPAENHDLAAEHPEILERLVALWWEEARQYQVLPLDDSLLARLDVKRPSVFEPRSRYTYRGRIRLPRPASPDVRDRSHTITARFVVTEDPAEGVLVSNGGLDGGYTLCLHAGAVHYVNNFLGRTHSTVSSEQPLRPGEHTAEVRFERTGKHAGRATLSLDGAVAGTVEIPATNPIAYAATEGLEVGSDSTSPIWPAYAPPFTFTGQIVEVTIDVLDDAAPLTVEEAAAQDRADMTRQ